MKQKLINLKNYQKFRLFLYLLIPLYFIIITVLILRAQNVIIKNHINNPTYKVANDFSAYYTGGLILLKDADNLYDLSTQFTVQKEYFKINSYTFLPYMYPPVAAYIFIPFTFLETETSNTIWLIFNVIIVNLLVFGIFLYYKSYDWWIRIAMVFFIIGLNPIMLNLVYGQISLILALVILASWKLYKSDKDLLSGLALSFLFIKPQYLPLPFLVIIFHRNLKMLTGFILGLISLIFISILTTGFNGINNYLNFLVQVNGWVDKYGRNVKIQYNLQAISSNFFGLNSSEALYIYLSLSILISILVIYIWYKYRNRNSYVSRMQWAILIIAMILISPHTNIQDYILLIPVLIFLIPKNSLKFKKIPNKIKVLTVALLPMLMIFCAPDLLFRIMLLLYLLIFLFLLIYETSKPQAHFKIQD